MEEINVVVWNKNKMFDEVPDPIILEIVSYLYVISKTRLFSTCKRLWKFKSNIDEVPYMREFKFAGRKRIFTKYEVTYASEVGDMELVQFFLKPLTRDDRDSALINGIRAAASKGHENVVKFFLKIKGNSRYAFEGAIINGQKQIVEMLFNSYHYYNWNEALHMSAEYGHQNLVEYFLNQQLADDIEGAMQVAKKANQTEIVEYFNSLQKQRITVQIFVRCSGKTLTFDMDLNRDNVGKLLKEIVKKGFGIIIKCSQIGIPSEYVFLCFQGRPLQDHRTPLASYGIQACK